MKQDDNPIDFFADLDAIVATLAEIGVRKDESSVMLRMLDGLTEEYSDARSGIANFVGRFWPKLCRESCEEPLHRNPEGNRTRTREKTLQTRSCPRSQGQGKA